MTFDQSWPKVSRVDRKLARIHRFGTTTYLPTEPRYSPEFDWSFSPNADIRRRQRNDHLMHFAESNGRRNVQILVPMLAKAF